MTLIGVVMAFTIIALVIGPAAFLVAQTTVISGQTRSQVVASQLAQASLSTVQSESEYDFSELADNIGTTTSTSTVGGIAYTVSTDVSWQEPDSSSADGACSTSTSTGALDPLLYATATVTWTNIGTALPVSITSSYHPPSSYFNPDDGTVVIDVENQDGQPQPGITVDLSDNTEDPSAVTSTNGCVVFPNLAPGDSWNDSLESPTNTTYVNREGSTNPGHFLQVTAGTTSDYTQYYAEAATVTYTTPTSPSGIVVPWALGLTLGSPGLPGDESDYLNEMSISDDPAGGTLTNVFPTPDNYALAIGSCVPFVDYASDVDPTVAVTPGGTSSGAVVGTPVTITVDSSATPTAPVAGVDISITNTTSSGTADGDCYNPSDSATDSEFATTSSSGTVTILAPFGSFTVTATSGSQSVTSAVETPTPESPTDVTLTL